MKQTRREFLIKSGCALSMTALATQVEHFGLMSAFAQKNDKNRVESAGDEDYRALVCTFFVGGNDGNNTIIPNHSDANVSGYAHYSAARAPQGLALAQNTLLPIAVPRIGGLTYGLHPSFGGTNGLHDLWAQGKMAVVSNVGTLVQPLTRAEYQAGAPRPYQLFSHSDQTAQHQTARADQPILSGWGGRISDKITASSNPGSLLPTVTTIIGTYLFTVGENTQPVAIGPAPTSLGSVLALIGYNNTPVSNARLTALSESLNMDANFELVREASRINRKAMEISQTLSASQDTTVVFPATELGNQLKQVARMIKARAVLNIRRQIFFVGIGGFDTHTAQLTSQAMLLTQFSQASRAFYDEMVAQGMQNNVTQFTLSDFNRTFNPGGSGVNVGSDHAWANHAFVIGGAVNGGDFYGMNTSNGTPFPTLVQNGPDDADSGGSARGRWIPTTSVEQYAATMARWFGLPESEMNYVFPNLNNFANTNLGFMQI